MGVVTRSLQPSPDGDHDDQKRELTAEQKKWKTDAFWKTPAWMVEDTTSSRLKSYEDYRKYNLRTKYIDLENDFRTTFNNFAEEPSAQMDLVTAGRIVDLLVTAREGLESEKVNLLTIESTLGFVDRYMIWIFPEHSVQERIRITAGRLKKSNPEMAKLLEGCLTEKDLGTRRMAYDEVIGVMNKEQKLSHISFGLQIERLAMLRSWGIVVLVAAILISPLLLNIGGVDSEGAYLKSIEDYFTKIHLDAFGGYIIILNLIIFGAIGGFISGLLQVRSTQVTLKEFRVSKLKFQLKPLVGGILAALASILLSWNILPGITIENLGSFSMIAFLSGFSERYFLSMLKLDEGKATDDDQPVGSVKDEDDV